ncbi:hypothetical protein GGR50DRAFT_691571 [Xylaria sp. CBS 124048]|nr:hypothetical protein GGR50DRAFT_691571 [Xylaria sp. CBS 124048]
MRNFSFTPRDPHHTSAPFRSALPENGNSPTATRSNSPSYNAQTYEFFLRFMGNMHLVFRKSGDFGTCFIVRPHAHGDGRFWLLRRNSTGERKSWPPQLTSGTVIGTIAGCHDNTGESLCAEKIGTSAVIEREFFTHVELHGAVCREVKQRDVVRQELDERREAAGVYVTIFAFDDGTPGFRYRITKVRIATAREDGASDIDLRGALPDGFGRLIVDLNEMMVLAPGPTQGPRASKIGGIRRVGGHRHAED